MLLTWSLYFPYWPCSGDGSGTEYTSKDILSIPNNYPKLSDTIDTSKENVSKESTALKDIIDLLIQTFIKLIIPMPF